MGTTLRNFTTWTAWECGYKFLGPAPLTFWRAKNVQNLARFRTTSDFDREYLGDGERYRQAESGVINPSASYAEERNRVNFGARLMFTHPKSTVRVISDSSALRSHTSLERIIKPPTRWKRRYQLRSLQRSTTKMVTFDPLTRKFTRLMFTHPKWTLRVLCIRQVAFLGAKFVLPKLSPQSDLRSLPHRSQLGQSIDAARGAMWCMLAVALQALLLVNRAVITYSYIV